MAKKGLEWVENGRYCKRKDGSFPKCGRSGGEKENIQMRPLQKQER